MEKCQHFNAIVRREDNFGMMYCYACGELVQASEVLNTWSREFRRIRDAAMGLEKRVEALEIWARANGWR